MFSCGKREGRLTHTVAALGLFITQARHQNLEGTVLNLRFCVLSKMMLFRCGSARRFERPRTFSLPGLSSHSLSFQRREVAGNLSFSLILPNSVSGSSEEGGPTRGNTAAALLLLELHSANPRPLLLSPQIMHKPQGVSVSVFCFFFS